MNGDVTSKHLRGTSELLLLIPIRSGFVNSSAPTSYATRLRTLLSTLYDLRKVTVERDLSEGSGPIERLQSILSTQWAVLDQMEPPHLMVSAVFDRSWEDYVQILVEKTGKLLDAIFCHCVGYEGHTCADGHEAFGQWLRRHQIRCDFFHTGMPDLTLDDLRYFKKTLTRLKPTDDPRTVTIGSVSEEHASTGGLPASGQVLKAVQDSLAGLFPADKEFNDLKARDARTILSDAVLNLGPPTTVERYSHREELSDAALASIQGGILTRYPKMTHGWVVLVRCADAHTMRALIGNLLPGITRQSTPQSELPRLNFALTYAGFERLELGRDVLSTLPREFCEGMAARAGLLGDLGASHPTRWQVLKRHEDETGMVGLDEVDAVVIVQTQDAPGEPAPLPSKVETLIESSKARIVHVQPLRRHFEENGQFREHFGFLDSGDPGSASQPVPSVVIGGSDLAAGAPSRDVVPLGELLLGYPNRCGTIAYVADPNRSRAAQLFKDGSFLVIRKLSQDVEALEEYADRLGKPDAVKASLMGRDSQGNTLVTGNWSNDFDYTNDPTGTRCPLHAHIRRANPRVPGAATPRIMRRSFAYGSRYSPETRQEDRGLMFMAYNGSIAEQFEVVQRWLNGGNSTGLPSAQNDMLVAAHPMTGAARHVTLGWTAEPLPQPKKAFVTLCWGLYLFAPSVKALKMLASRGATSSVARTTVKEAPPPTLDRELVARGEQLIQTLDAIADRALAIQGWRRMLEEPACRLQARAIWAALRQKNVVKQTPYGALVATVSGAYAVLSDTGKQFSVREYWERLRLTMGEHYLGLDPEVGQVTCPATELRDEAYEDRYGQGEGYADLSGAANAYIGTLSAKAYDDALRFAQDFIAHRAVSAGARMIPIFELAKVVIGRAAKEWIGVPLREPWVDADLVKFLDNYIAVSKYCFQPYPDDWMKQEAVAGGHELQSRYSDQRPPKGAMATARGLERPDAAMIGAIVGFAPPAVATIITLLDGLAERGELARLAANYLEQGESTRRAFLERLVSEEMMRAPQPPILYRTAMDEAQLDGIELAPGSLVVIGLQSVCEDARARGKSEPWQWIFGGSRTPPAGTEAPVHACPGRYAAFDAILATLAAVLALKNLRRAGRMVLAYDVV
jgi:hypothetical protein